MNATEWLADLEAKADAATPGPWKRKNHANTDIVSISTKFFVLRDGIIDNCNADFIAAANPDTVKKLVMMIEHLAYLACDTDKGNDDKQAEQNIQWAFEESDPRRYA